MADIKKNLIVQAKLQDAALKKQIQALKKNLGEGITLQGQDLNAFKKTFQDVAKSFSEEIRKALKQTGTPGGGSRGGRSASPAAINAQAWDEYDKERGRVLARQEKELERLNQHVKRLNQEAWNDYDKEMAASLRKRQQMEQKFGGGAFTDISTGKVVRPQSQYQQTLREQDRAEKQRQQKETQFERRKEILRDMRMENRQKKSMKHERNILELRERRMERIQRNEELDKTGTVRTLTAMGVDRSRARDIAEQGVTRGGGRFGRALGIAGGVGAAAGAATFGTLGIMRQFRERQHRFTTDMVQGQHLEAIARREGREDLLPKAGGFLGGAAAGAAGGAAIGGGIGALFGGIGAAPGALIGGAIGAVGGGVAGMFGASNLAGEVNVEEVQPLIQAYQRARQVSPLRRQAMRGGGLPFGGTASLNILQNAGAQEGFAPEETMQQFLQSRQFLGNRGTSRNLRRMQDMFNVTGVQVGAQAESAELFAGAGRTGFGQGVTQTIDVLKKGVSAGLDISRSGKFLQTTAEFVRRNTGFAQLDVDKITESLARTASGFAGDGEVTGVQLQQAARLQELTRGASGQMGGLAGGANFQNIMQATGGAISDPFALMGLAQASNFGGDAVRQILQEQGIEGDQLEQMTNQIMQGKQNPAAAAGRLLFGEQGPQGLGQQQFVLGQQGLGFSRFTEDTQGINRGLAGGQLAPMDQVEDQFATTRDAIKQTDEFQLAIAEATQASKQVSEGIMSFDAAIKGVNASVTELDAAIKRARDAFNDMLADVDIAGKAQ